MEKVCMLMKALFFALLVGMPFGAKAQPTTPPRNETYAEELREKIGIDYTVPDYNVKRPNAQVMGWRLAKILQSLEQNHEQSVYNKYLALILKHQTDEYVPPYLLIDKMKILGIRKRGNVVSIRMRLSSKVEGGGKIEQDVQLSFNNNISDDDAANTLFAELGRHVKMDE